MIDMDSVLFSAFSPNKVLGFDGVPERTVDNKRFIYKEKSCLEVMESCDFLMNRMLTNSKATHFVSYVKGRDTTKNKELINPLYKSDRGSSPPYYWRFTKEYMKIRWGAIEANGCETDDMVRIANLKIKNSFIVAIDSDLLGLEGTHFNWRTNEWITTTKYEEDYKFWSDMITGTHNFCKGIPGKGSKYVEKYLISSVSSRQYPEMVLIQYIDHFGEKEGIREFNSQYFCNKILEDYEHFSIPELIEFSNEIEF